VAEKRAVGELVKKKVSARKKVPKKKKKKRGEMASWHSL
jgi:hypothetical protein